MTPWWSRPSPWMWLLLVALPYVLNTATDKEIWLQINVFYIKRIQCNLWYNVWRKVLIFHFCFSHDWALDKRMKHLTQRKAVSLQSLDTIWAHFFIRIICFWFALHRNSDRIAISRLLNVINLNWMQRQIVYCALSWFCLPLRSFGIKSKIRYRLTQCSNVWLNFSLISFHNKFAQNTISSKK